MVRGIAVVLMLGSMVLVQADQIRLKEVGVEPALTGSFDWPNLNYTGGVWAGEYQLSIDWEPDGVADEVVGGFCVEDVWSPTSHELYELKKPSEISGIYDEYERAAWLFDQYESGPKTNLTAAATQVAIWELVLDPGNYNIDAGQFSVRSLDYTIRDKAGQLLDGAGLADLTAFDADANYCVAWNPLSAEKSTQNYLIPHSVPEPASISLLLLGLGLLGVSGYRRRSTRS